MAFPFSVDDVLTTFAIILVLGLFLPEIAQKWRISTVPFYIIAGMVIGPYGLGILQSHPALSFVGELGLYFLVFIAGLEVYRSSGTKWKEPGKLSAVFAVVCFLAGFLFGTAMGYGILTSLLIGTILVSSSVGEIIPMVNSNRKLKEKASHLIIPGVVILDTLSLVGIALLTRYSGSDGGSAAWDFVLFTLAIVVFFIVGVVIIPRVAKWYFSRKDVKVKEGDLKFIIAALFVIVAVSEIINLHGIVAAFFAGLLLGRSLPHKKEFKRIEGIGHALLIPVFFIVLGIETNIRILWSAGSAIILAAGLLFTLFFSKMLAGAIYGVAGGFRNKKIKKGVLMGVIFWPQLSATIAATVVGREFGLVDDPLFVSVIFMAIVSATLTPFLVPILWKDSSSPLGVKDHIVLIGVGSMGSVVLDYLMDGGKDFVVIERDIERVKWLRTEWVPYAYGQAEERATLKRANIEAAEMVVVCIGEDYVSERIVKRVKKLNPNCMVIVRVHKPEYVRLLATAEAVIRPESVMGNEIIAQIERLYHGHDEKRAEEEQNVPEDVPVND